MLHRTDGLAISVLTECGLVSMGGKLSPLYQYEVAVTAYRLSTQFDISGVEGSDNLMVDVVFNDDKKPFCAGDT